MTLIIYQVDAFTDRPFTGNPAAVCLLSAPANEAWMQRLAGEMNVSETAFLLREAEGYRLRWMNPTVEVDLCGHATLASAHILWETGAPCGPASRRASIPAADCSQPGAGATGSSLTFPPGPLILLPARSG
jgi:PhzF family phenazine biosynthesis protein